MAKESTKSAGIVPVMSKADARRNRSETPPKVGQYVAKPKRIRHPDTYVNELYKLTQTRKRLDELGHDATVKVFDGFIAEAEAKLVDAKAWADRQEAEAEAFRKETDVNRLRRMGISRDAMETLLNE